MGDAPPGGMAPAPIDLISSYCDRWCERCAFTARCAVFLTDTAIAMCGDAGNGIELALGDAAAPRGDPGAVPEAGSSDDALPSAVSQKGLAEYGLEEERRDRNARINATAVAQTASTYTVFAYRWLKDQESRAAGADAVLAEAWAIVAHDVLLIGGKLHRALLGRDRRLYDGEEGHPVQNDANGSAKVALLCIERSEAAWWVIADATGEPGAATCADLLADLRRDVEAAFPGARSFIRPGFDAAGIGGS